MNIKTTATPAVSPASAQCAAKLRFLLPIACAALTCGFTAPTPAPPATVCEQAGRTAEQAFSLPSGLLLAIGRVESGRRDTRLGRIVPWPWSIDVNGQGRQFESAQDAIKAIRALRAPDSASIDVGCFQINLARHPDAFSSLMQAFDPQANAQYAARFLASLRARLGSWQDAVAAYHSATPDLGVPYQKRVFAAWTGSTEDSLVSGAQFTIIAGVRIWGPSPAAIEPQVIAISPASSGSLPRVITPSR